MFDGPRRLKSGVTYGRMVRSWLVGWCWFRAWYDLRSSMVSWGLTLELESKVLRLLRSVASAAVDICFFFGMLSGDLTISYLSECRTYYSNRMIVGMVGNGKITLKWIGWMIFHGVGCHTMRNRCWSSIWPYGITWLGEVPNGQSICGSNFWLTTHFWNLVLF